MSRPRARPESVVVPFARARAGARLDADRLVPSGRSLLLAFALLAGALGAWFLARETPLFALRTIEVSGGSAPTERQVRRVLATEVGHSLLKLDATRVESRLEDLPTVVSVRLDRAFPHELRVAVVPEVAVLVVRQGADSWLVSARARVIGTVQRGSHARLPRLWVKRDVPVERGDTLGGDLAAGVLAVRPLPGARLPRVATVRMGDDGLTLALRSGLLIRLGEAEAIRLKLAVAARLVPLLDDGTAYVDVSVPERPVAGTDLNSQVEVQTATSTAT